MKTKKNPPVDRGKLLIAVECCRDGRIETCLKCPYFKSSCDTELMNDALAYICYLEQQLGVTGL